MGEWKSVEPNWSLSIPLFVSKDDPMILEWNGKKYAIDHEPLFRELLRIGFLREVE